MLLFTLAQGLVLSRYIQGARRPGRARHPNRDRARMPTTCPTARGRRSQADLQRLLQPLSLQVRNDSHHHIGHAGAREGGHFTVRLVSRLLRGAQPGGAASPRL